VARSRNGTSVEAEVLARVEPPHVVRLLDAATTSSGATCLVLERLERGSLARLLDHRTDLSAGEAVTILAPIAAALDAVHEAGATHGTIAARSVLFRANGAPVLACFGASSLSGGGRPPALVTLDSGVRSDREHLADLARIVLSRVPGGQLRPVEDWLADDVAGVDGFGSELVRRLFDAADADAVRFAAPAVVDPIPARIARSRPADEPASAIALIERIRRLGALVAGVARTVRTPVWVLAGSVLVGLVAVIALIPETSSAKDAVVPPSGTQTAATQTAATQSPTAGALVADPTMGDDPVAALGSLLTARDACVARLSALCFEHVDQAGSAALDEDVAYVREVAAGAEASREPADPAGAVLVETLGDTALVDLPAQEKHEASVLMIRTEAGWRFRDWFDG
jgi:hypothetical protein